MKNYQIICIIKMIILASCINKPTQNKFIESHKTPQKEGFTEMKIVKDKKNTCVFLLEDQYKNNYEVENLPSKIPNIKSGDIVWIKYHSLRKMSVCNAQPINITEIFNH